MVFVRNIATRVFNNDEIIIFVCNIRDEKIASDVWWITMMVLILKLLMLLKLSKNKKKR